jgi:hypothetical protein
MSKVNETIEDLEEEVYEDWQYEQSGIKASEFIEDELLPQIEKFDYDNEDQDYIYGTATFGLFIELIPRLAQLGYTKEELTQQVEQYVDYINNRVLH